MKHNTGDPRNSRFRNSRICNSRFFRRFQVLVIHGALLAIHGFSQHSNFRKLLIWRLRCEMKNQNIPIKLSWAAESALLSRWTKSLKKTETLAGASHAQSAQLWISVQNKLNSQRAGVLTKKVRSKLRIFWNQNWQNKKENENVSKSKKEGRQI